jgi:hypothetical protein
MSKDGRKYGEEPVDARAVQLPSFQVNVTGLLSGPIWLYLSDERKIAAKAGTELPHSDK